MTQKTDTFKNTQISKWEDGDLANGANFAQLLTAIATLIDETKTETISEVNAAAGSYTDTQAKEVVKAFLNTQSDYQNSNLYKTLKALIDGKVTTNDVLTSVKSVINTNATMSNGGFNDSLLYTTLNTKLLASAYVGSYTANINGDTGSLTLSLPTGGAVNVDINSGGKYITSTTTPYTYTFLSANGSSILLNRPDGGRIVVDRNAHTATPAAVLIG